ncbi:unnamed protein product [Rhodiola kirilowii]
MATGEGFDVPAMKPQSIETDAAWKQGVEQSQDQVDVLLAKLMEVKACIQGSEGDTKKELDFLWRRVKTTATLLTYLKSKARVMAALNLAMSSCGIKQLEGVGLVDRNGTPLSGWSRSLDLSSFDGPNVETWIGINSHQGCILLQAISRATSASRNPGCKYMCQEI